MRYESPTRPGFFDDPAVDLLPIRLGASGAVASKSWSVKVDSSQLRISAWGVAAACNAWQAHDLRTTSDDMARHEGACACVLQPETPLVIEM